MASVPALYEYDYDEHAEHFVNQLHWSTGMDDHDKIT
jgi:hypothetical protein